LREDEDRRAACAGVRGSTEPGGCDKHKATVLDVIRVVKEKINCGGPRISKNIRADKGTALNRKGSR